MLCSLLIKLKQRLEKKAREKSALMKGGASSAFSDTTNGTATVQEIHLHVLNVGTNVPTLKYSSGIVLK